MALTKCSECGKEVSEKAFTCPNCGKPLQDISKATQRSPVTIEQTKKKWKVVRLISWLMIITGVILFIKGLADGSNSLSFRLGIFVGFFGIVGSLIGKFGSWWSNR